MKIKTIASFLIGALVLVTTSCKKDKDDNKTLTELLTQKKWILVSYGNDHNSNGIVDATEENIRECEKDNEYLFNTNGTGVVFENAQNCDGGPSKSNFQWKFINNEKQIDFFFGLLNIEKITETDMVLFHEADDQGKKLRLLFLYKHP